MCRFTEKRKEKKMKKIVGEGGSKHQRKRDPKVQVQHTIDRERKRKREDKKSFGLS